MLVSPPPRLRIVAPLLLASLINAGCPKDPPAVLDAGAVAVALDAGPVADPADLQRAEAALQKALAGKICPEGTRRVGAEPPEGREAWCERPTPPGGGQPVRHGPYEAWHDNGVKSVTGSYVEGEREGAWVLWHPNGQRHQEWHYSHSVPDGAFREWDEHGEAVASVVYKDGKVQR